MSFKIIVDSCCDLTPAQLREGCFLRVPLTIHVGDASIVDDATFNQADLLWKMRESESAPFRVLSPCGICQERLRYWGAEVQVGVTAEAEPPLFVPLKQLQPYHWTDAYPPEELEHFEKDECGPCG